MLVLDYLDQIYHVRIVTVMYKVAFRNKIVTRNILLWFFNFSFYSFGVTNNKQSNKQNLRNFRKKLHDFFYREHFCVN